MIKRFCFIASIVLLLNLFLSGHVFAENQSIIDGVEEPTSFTISESAYCFENVTAGETSSPHTFTITNTSSSKSLNLVLYPSNTENFEIVNDFVSNQIIEPGNSKTFDIRFKSYTSGNYTCAITIVDKYTGILITAYVTGIAVPTNEASGIKISESYYDFGNLNVGDTSPIHTFTLTNTNTDKDLMLIPVPSDTTNFEIINDNVSNQLIAPGESKTFDVRFKPVSSGTHAEIITVVDILSGTTLTAKVSGMGIGAPPVPSLTISETNFDFGEVAVGTTSQNHTFTVTNTSDSKNSMLLISLSSANNFEILNNNASNQLIAPGESKTFDIRFKPDSAGKCYCFVVIVDLNSGSLLTFNVSGTGI